MAENLVRLDLGRFTAADVSKILGLQAKLRLMHRWFRHERKSQDGTETIVIYSGDRGPTPYASYRFVRHRDGRYELVNARTQASLAKGRTIDAVMQALPDDFFYAK
jgi:hypothetical protein